MLREKQNADQASTNALVWTKDLHAGCCNPDPSLTLNDYTLTVDVTTITGDDIVSIDIAGTTYTFAAAVDATLADNVVPGLLHAQIDAVLVALTGYHYDGGLKISKATNDLTITFIGSHLAFEQIDGASTSHAFTETATPS